MRFNYSGEVPKIPLTIEQMSFNEPQVLPEIVITAKKPKMQTPTKAVVMAVVAAIVSILTVLAAIKVLRSKKV